MASKAKNLEYFPLWLKFSFNSEVRGKAAIKRADSQTCLTFPSGSRLDRRSITATLEVKGRHICLLSSFIFFFLLLFPFVNC